MAERAFVAMLLLLGACASPPARPDNDALSRFEELLRFLPEDMQSYWFSDARGLEFNRLEPDVLGVHAGRDFEAPDEHHVGRHALVEVSWREANAPAPAIDEYRDHSAASPIDGHPVWCTTGSSDGTPRWVAFVDGRFTVRASSPELLARALRRDGTRERMLRSLPPPSAFSVDAREFFLLLPRPQPTEVPHFRPHMLCGAPSPTSPLLAEACLDGLDYTRLRFVGSSREDLETYARIWTAFTHLPASEVQSHGSVFAIHFEMRDPAGLYLYLLFGLHLMI